MHFSATFDGVKVEGIDTNLAFMKVFIFIKQNSPAPIVAIYFLQKTSIPCLVLLCVCYTLDGTREALSVTSMNEDGVYVFYKEWNIYIVKIIYWYLQELICPVTPLGNHLVKLYCWKDPMKSLQFCLVLTYVFYRVISF